MKTTTLAAALWIVALGSAQPFTVNWSESPTHFTLNLTGTGMNWTDSFVSPLGLWQLDVTLDPALHLTDSRGIHDGPMIEMNHWAIATYLGEESHSILFADPYHDMKPAITPFYDGNYFVPIPLSYPSDQGLIPGWNGLLPFNVTSIPDPTDTSTWSWVLTIFAYGPEFTSPVSVPEDGGILCLAFAAGLLLFWRQKGLMA